MPLLRLSAKTTLQIIGLFRFCWLTNGWTSCSFVSLFNKKGLASVLILTNYFSVLCKFLLFMDYQRLLYYLNLPYEYRIGTCLKWWGIIIRAYDFFNYKIFGIRLTLSRYLIPNTFVSRECFCCWFWVFRGIPIGI